MRKPAVLVLVCSTVAFGCGDTSASDSEKLARIRRSVARPVRPPVEYGQDYEFTTDWLSHKLPVWRRVLAPYMGQPDVHYLEIGLFEGRSALWMLENVLTHPTSRLTGIDPFFEEEVRARYERNIELSGSADKVTTLVGLSQERLREVPLRSFDIVYIDGSHRPEDVISDAVQAFEVVKPGGLIIFDDYLGAQGLPYGQRAQIAIDFFLHTYSRRYSRRPPKLEVVHSEYQVIVRRL